MKKLLFLLLGLVIITTACQTNTELTDADKDVIVESVKQASQEYWSILSSTYDSETYSKAINFIDENSDQMWQTEPVAMILNTTNIFNKQEDWLTTFEEVISNRISTPCKILEAYYSVLSNDKVLEVIVGNASYTKKDSTVVGPFKYVNTKIWSNIDGEWKFQFDHQSTDWSF